MRRKKKVRDEQNPFYSSGIVIKSKVNTLNNCFNLDPLCKQIVNM